MRAAAVKPPRLVEECELKAQVQVEMAHAYLSLTRVRLSRVEQGGAVAPGEGEAAGGGWGHWLRAEELVDAFLGEGDAGHGSGPLAGGDDCALAVGGHEVAEDVVEDVCLDDCDGEDLSPECQGIEADAEAGHADGALRSCLVQGSEGLGAFIVDQGAEVAVVLEVAEELLAVLPHRVAPQVEIMRVRGT